SPCRRGGCGRKYPGIWRRSAVKPSRATVDFVNGITSAERTARLAVWAAPTTIHHLGPVGLWSLPPIASFTLLNKSGKRLPPRASHDQVGALFKVHPGGVFRLPAAFHSSRAFRPWFALTTGSAPTRDSPPTLHQFVSFCCRSRAERQ